MGVGVVLYEGEEAYYNMKYKTWEWDPYANPEIAKVGEGMYYM